MRRTMRRKMLRVRRRPLRRNARPAGGGSRDHPSFEEIIRECIRESKEDRREGVSRPTIKSTFSTSPRFLHSAFAVRPPVPAAVRWVGGGGGQMGNIGFGTSGALTRLLM
jgi:hypothetical protein